MNAPVQLDLFEKMDDLTLLKKEVEEIRIRGDNVRRGLFARHNDLAKLFIEQQEQIDYLKKIMCLK